MNEVKLLVCGAGSRGNAYTSYLDKTGIPSKVVGVAEPREFHRSDMASRFGIPQDNVFSDWKAMAARPRFADAVLVTTQDRMHADPAIAFAGKGYHIMLEKPMASNPEDCRRIAAAAKASGGLFAVCHVLRYTRFTRKLKEMIDSGIIGDVVSVQHLEPVGYWHQAHSFVRGNWRNEKMSSPMLLAKSCHDLDWISHIMGNPKCLRISSFGGLHHFKKEQKPAEAGSAKRCVECAHEPKCPYSAIKIYVGRAKHDKFEWPVDILTPERTVAAVEAAVREGPYGRCVFECDNDVVDHQVVNMEFDGCRTASFTMTAFTLIGGRHTRIFGTLGSIHGDSQTIVHYDYLSDKKEIIDTEAGADQTAAGGHGGGDYGLIRSFVEAVAANDSMKILSGPDVSLETHMMVFAAEKARRENRVVVMDDYMRDFENRNQQ